MKQGISLVELIIAIAVFTVFTTSSVMALIGGLRASRTASEQVVANEYTAEGYEAMRSIKNQSFALATNSATTYGLVPVGNKWITAGTSSTFDKYTMTVDVNDVQRDTSGNIVSSGGTVDPLTKKIVTTTSWNYNSAIANSVVATSYATNWKLDIATPSGLLVYGNGSTTTDAVQYKILDGRAKTWSVAGAFPDVDTGSTNKALRAIRMYSNPNKREIIAITKHYDGTSTQYLYATVWNGFKWNTPTQLVAYASTATIDARSFDGAFLKDGTFLLVYNDSGFTTRTRTWNGTSWSAQGSGPTMNAGAPVYIVTRARPGTSEVMLAVFDNASDTTTAYYNGSTWSGITSHATAAPTATGQLVDFAWSQYNPLKGALVYTTATTSKVLTAKIWTANGSGSGAWSSAATSGSSTGNVAAINITARPSALEFVACQKDAGARGYCFEVDGTPTWTTPTNNNFTTTSATGVQRTFDVDYEQLNGAQGVVVYSDNTTTTKLKKYDPSTNTFDAAATSLTASTNVVQSIQAKSLPGSDDILFLIGDSTRALYSVIWNGATNAVYTSPTGYAWSTHGTNGSASTDFWYEFAWDNYVQASNAAHLQSNIAVGAGGSASQAVTLPNFVNPGSLIVVAVSSFNSTAANVTSVTDNKSNTYTKVASNGTGTHQISVWYAQNVNPGTGYSITANGAANSFFTVAAHEYTGMSAVSAVDQTANSNGTGTAASTGNTPTTVLPNEIVFAAFLHEAAGTVTMTPGANFSLRQSQTNGANEPLMTEDRLVGSTNAYAGTMTLGSSNNWRGVVATFKDK